MKATTVFLSALIVVFTLALLAAPAPASAQIHCSQCTCASACTTACYYLERTCEPITQDGGGCTFETINTTCGAWGTCTTASGCGGGGSCSNNVCTSTINLGSGNDTYNGTANHECIYGNGGSDTLDGKAGDDRIYGGTGTDTLYGDSGDDCLWGEGNNDHLDGGSGTDYCNGGAGTNTLANCEY